jgi:hypothetical protein
MNRDEITEKLSQIKSNGYIRSMRKGSTGVGYTLEKLFDIAENNLQLPNLKETELKAKRERSPCPITIFTCDRDAWGPRGSQINILKKYGYPDNKGRLAMYHLLKPKPNAHGLFLAVDDTKVSVRHTDGTSIANWSLENLAKRLDTKTKNILLISAKVDMRDDIEYFLYDRALWCHNVINDSHLKSLFEGEKLMIDLRLYRKSNGSIKNHGTGFRIRDDNLSDLYQTIEEISF